MTLAYLYCAAQGFESDTRGDSRSEDSRTNEFAAKRRDASQLQKLVVGVRQGDEAAFEHLFRLFYNRIVRYVRVLVHEPAIAEDVAQTVFARLWERREGWIVETTVEAYLIRAARNQAIDVMRRDRREHRWEDLEVEAPAGSIPTAIAATDRTAEQQDLIQHVNRAIVRLSVRHREILALKWGGQYSYAEIAEITGQPIRTVETQVARAIKALRILLGGVID